MNMFNYTANIWSVKSRTMDNENRRTNDVTFIHVVKTCIFLHLKHKLYKHFFHFNY